MKKRIQIPEDLQLFYRIACSNGMTPILLGVYTFQDTLVFCDFDLKTYIEKKAHNSSSHIITHHHQVGIKLLLNDYYDLLKLMHDNEAIILDEKVIPLTQQQIATTLNYSKMKVNSMFGVLQKEGFVEQKTRGKYVLMDTAESIIKTIEKLYD